MSRRFIYPGAPPNASDAVCAFLKRELRSAMADYRMLALHAGSSDHVTIEAKQRIIRLTALLQTENSKRRTGDSLPLQQHDAADAAQDAVGEAPVTGRRPRG